MLPLVSRRQSSPPPPFSIPLWGQLISHEHVNIYTRTTAIFMFAPAEYCCPTPPAPAPAPLQNPHHPQVTANDPTNHRLQLIATIASKSDDCRARLGEPDQRSPRSVAVSPSTSSRLCYPYYSKVPFKIPRDLRGLQIVIQWLQYLDCEQRMI